MSSLKGITVLDPTTSIPKLAKRKVLAVKVKVAKGAAKGQKHVTVKVSYQAKGGTSETISIEIPVTIG